MQALNSSSFVLTKKSGVWRLGSACATKSGFVTTMGVLPVLFLYGSTVF